MRFRKGISPLIAAVLLIAFTMAVASIFAQWAPQLIQGAQQGTEEQQSDLLGSVDAQVEIMDVKYNSSSGNFSLTVRNDGGTSIENLTTSLYGDNPVQKKLDKELDKGEVTTIEVNTGTKQGYEEAEVESKNPSSGDREDLEGVEEESSTSSNNGGGSNTCGSESGYSCIESFEDESLGEWTIYNGDKEYSSKYASAGSMALNLTDAGDSHVVYSNPGDGLSDYFSQNETLKVDLKPRNSHFYNYVYFGFSGSFGSISDAYITGVWNKNSSYDQYWVGKLSGGSIDKSTKINLNEEIPGKNLTYEITRVKNSSGKYVKTVFQDTNGEITTASINDNEYVGDKSIALRTIDSDDFAESYWDNLRIKQIN